jgi:sugar phosphate isomerase/epimerase
MFSISTVWNAWRHSSAEAMAKELLSFGCEAIELSFTLPPELFPGVLDLARAGKVKVSSLHNYCPPPLFPSSGRVGPDSPSLSSRDGRERTWAVNQTMRTIDAARAMKARAVVLHMGKIPLRDAGRKVLALAVDGGDQLRLRSARDSFLRKRAKLAGFHLEEAVRSLTALAAHAASAGILLGVENRYFLEEIPSLDEVGIILERVPSPALGYWHDIGHAQVKENAGLEEHAEYLKRYGHRLIGMHIHDVIGASDHRAPLQGEFDYGLVKDYLRRDILKVFEIHPQSAPEEVKRGIEHIRKLVDG